MADFFWFSDEQWARIEPLLPQDTRGMPRVDDRRVLSGIVHALKSGGRWGDCPEHVYGPKKTLYNRFRLWAGRVHKKLVADWREGMRRRMVLLQDARTLRQKTIAFQVCTEHFYSLIFLTLCRSGASSGTLALPFVSMLFGWRRWPSICG